MSSAYLPTATSAGTALLSINAKPRFGAACGEGAKTSRQLFAAERGARTHRDGVDFGHLTKRRVEEELKQSLLNNNRLF